GRLLAPPPAARAAPRALLRLRLLALAVGLALDRLCLALDVLLLFLLLFFLLERGLGLLDRGRGLARGRLAGGLLGFRLRRERRLDPRRVRQRRVDGAVDCARDPRLDLLAHLRGGARDDDGVAVVPSDTRARV